MKYTIIISALFLTACTTPHKNKSVTVVLPPVAGTTLSSAEIDTIRSGEVVKKYYVGAYVDPAHPQVRHDPHMVERVEQSTRWNLRPNAPVVASGPSYKAVEDNALKNAMQLQQDYQMKQQRDANAAIQAQSSGLKEEMNILKSKLSTQYSSEEIKKLEEKIDSLNAKINSMEQSSIKPNTEQINNQVASSQNRNNTQQQSLNSWENPL